MARSTEVETEKIVIYPGKIRGDYEPISLPDRVAVLLPFFFRARRRRQAVQVGLKFGWRRMSVSASISNLLVNKLSGTLYSPGT